MRVSDRLDSVTVAAAQRKTGNPFRPSPGTPPPALVGRIPETSAAVNALQLVREGAMAQPIVFTGLRGMGKTVLLRAAIGEARALGGIVIPIEASREIPLGASLRTGLEDAQRDTASLPAKLKGAMDALLTRVPRTSFTLPNEMGAIALEAAAVPERELYRGLEDLNDDVRKHEKFLVFAIDEVQETPVAGMRDLIIFLHRLSGTDRPAYLLAAGLPNSREHLHEARTYTERWRFFRLDLLAPEDARAAVATPLRERGVTIDAAALDLIVAESAGYPFFVQEYGSAAWANRSGDHIALADVERAVPGVRRVLENDFYDARFRLLTPRECGYVLALASLGPGAHTSGEIADRLGATSTQLGSVRYQLAAKDVIYSPTPGMSEFRIPLTEQYVLRHETELRRRAQNTPRANGRTPRT